MPALRDLLLSLPWPVPRPVGNPEITAVTQDSRKAQPGTLFVARTGGSVDGHRFIPAALEAGAAAIVGNQPAAELALPATVPYVQVPDPQQAVAWLAAALHGFPARRMVMIGVTGTDGKTTTANLIYSVLRAAGLRAGLVSTVNAVIGDRVLDTGLHVTTPDPEDVQRYLAEMVSAGLTHCVLEATSHGLAQHRVTACEFDVAVVTNITHEHLDFHGSLAAYRDAKARLFEMLGETVARPGVRRFAVLNRDDGSFDYLPARVGQGAAVVSYGLSPAADIHATGIHYRSDGLSYTAVIPGQPLPIDTPLLGEFNVSNTLAAVAVGHGLGLDPTAIQRGIRQLGGIPGRMERITVDAPHDFSVIVDFAHTPNSLRAALNAARAMTTARVIVVFGSAGLRDVEKRTTMGQVAGELADQIIVTAEDPRTESLTALIAASVAGAESRGAALDHNLFAEPDRQTAINRAVEIAGPGDIVLICGKAHEQSMCFGTVEYPWDDRVAARAALAARLGLPAAPVPALPTRAPGWRDNTWA